MKWLQENHEQIYFFPQSHWGKELDTHGSERVERSLRQDKVDSRNWRPLQEEDKNDQRKSKSSLEPGLSQIT